MLRLDIIDTWVRYAQDRLMLDDRDVDWMRNRVLDYLSIHPEVIGKDPIDNDELMGILSAAPSQIQNRFEHEEQDSGGMAAMQWLYDYGVSNGYIKEQQLSKNVRFERNGLIVTINLAKPEFKDMRKAAMANSVEGSFASCTICHENEGLGSRDKRTLRTVPITLGGTEWFWQFSPYGYFNKHGICVNRTHVPMHVDRQTLVNLLDFVDQFPGFFLGCNAALPRIGGSVLAHDHYQGGGELLPICFAPALTVLHVADVPDVVIEVLDWPASAVRVVSENRESIIEVTDRIRIAWGNYRNRKTKWNHMMYTEKRNLRYPLQYELVNEDMKCASYSGTMP